MKIKTVEVYQYYQVTTDECTYRRDDVFPDWEILLGERWESIHDCDELEKEFRKFQKNV
jgi:hypothetical protein